MDVGALRALPFIGVNDMFFKRRPKVFSFNCSECGETHKGSPSLYQKRPAFYLNVPISDRDSLTVISDDLCIVYKTPDKVKDTATYGIRTILEIPIINVVDPMLLGVWVTQSYDSFKTYVETFDDNQNEFMSFGWLQVNQPHYTSYEKDEFLTSLACDVIGQSAGGRPKVRLHEAEHELFYDQCNGISWDKAANIYKLWIHK